MSEPPQTRSSLVEDLGSGAPDPRKGKPARGKSGRSLDPSALVKLGVAVVCIAVAGVVLYSQFTPPEPPEYTPPLAPGETQEEVERLLEQQRQREEYWRENPSPDNPKPASS